jgi:NAD-dependent SIR2 family protein deacetylase
MKRQKVPGKASESHIKRSSKKRSKPEESGRSVPPLFPLHRSNSTPTFRDGFSSVVTLLQDCKNIVVLTGAGISVSCGIPDFRTRGSGLYSTLNAEEYGLSCPEELFDWEFFQENPQPFYRFARKLYFPLGNHERVRPSDSHKLIALLDQKKMLLRCYSQNIDGLEEAAGVSVKKIVYAHGSLQWATCLKCKRKVSAKDIEADILRGTVARCKAPLHVSSNSSTTSTSSVTLEVATSGKSPSYSPSSSSIRRPTPPLREPSARHRKRQRVKLDDEALSDESECGGVLKPAVTFFGEALPQNVKRCLESDRHKVDALIVMGTSLSV